MSVTSVPVLLQARFAHDLAGLAIPWRAEAAPDPQLVALNDGLAIELGLDPAWLRTTEGVGLLTGTLPPPDATPVAQAYAGHQFGGFVPRLGDGRALLLGELVDTHGRLRDLHLKGSGRTPFARGGDGLAALGPMLREYLISEAMHALGVPTTRSLSVVATGRTVQREDLLPGAVLARVASSHLRIGSFQYAATTGDLDLLRRLADHAIARHHPAAADADNPHLALLDAVVATQASLLARWMLVGFVHGVMNTDNMTISGETIDYGPCAFLDAYDPTTVYSSIDHSGRYAFGNQPVVAQWNLARLAETLLPLIDPDQDRAVELAVASLDAFPPRYDEAWTDGMRSKLGLAGPCRAPRRPVGDLAHHRLGLPRATQPRRPHRVVPRPGRRGARRCRARPRTVSRPARARRVAHDLAGPSTRCRPDGPDKTTSRSNRAERIARSARSPRSRCGSRCSPSWCTAPRRGTR